MISPKCPASQSWTESLPALSRARRAQRAGILKNFFSPTGLSTVHRPHTPTLTLSNLCPGAHGAVYVIITTIRPIYHYKTPIVT